LFIKTNKKMETISTTVTSTGVGSTQTASPKAVTFKSNGLKIAGHLYFPAVVNQVNGLTPAIVVGHPGAGVKEQTAGLYAK
jgi:fermentation-respiration switch protein FrsA (DUF1100 family)